MKTYLKVHERGLETVAIWQQYAPALKVGTITLAAHAAEVNLLDAHALAKVDAENQWEMARLARNAAAESIDAVCGRVCELVASTLPEDDDMRALVRGVRGVTGRAYEAVTERGKECLDLWTKFNAHGAALSPAQPALVVDVMDAASFASARGNYAQLLANTKDKDIAHDRKASQLAGTVQRVDRQNKRWFQAWRARFAAGTPEHTALRRVTTTTGQATPGQGVFLAHETLPGPKVRLVFDAARATSFTLLHRGPGQSAFTVLADGLTAKTFEHAVSAPGRHSYKVTGHNSAGTGVESGVFEVTVAQQAVA